MDEKAKSAESVHWLAGALGLGGIAAIVTSFWLPGGKIGVLIGALILLLVVVVVVGYLFWQERKRKKASQGFTDSLSQNAAQTAIDIKDANQIAELDRLRKRFEDGIQVY